MDLIQLQYFQTAAQEQHFTRAAEKLNVSQPTLSASISRLENELGCHLFSRTGRQIHLNAEGQTFLKYANTILEAYQNALDELNLMQKSDSNVVSVAVMTMHVHSKFLLPFCRAYPDIHLRQKLLLVDNISATFQDTKTDFILANMPINDENAAHLHLTTDDLYLAVSRSHPLARKRTYSIEDIQNERFVIPLGGTGFNHIFENLFRSKHLPLPDVTYALPSEWQSYLDNGYAAISTEAYFSKGNFDSSVAFLPPEDSACQRVLYLIWNRKHALSKSAKIFLQYMESAAAQKK